jgi:membrane dipeptidase
MTFEGLEPLADDLQFLEVYYKLGLRVAGLTHMRRNLFADGAFEGIKTGGLTVYGQRAVRRMNELGIVIDLAHISEEGFWEILHLTEDPVVLSHSTSTMFPAGPPNSKAPIVGIERPGLVLSRDRGRLEAIAQNGGVIGIIFFTQRDISDVVADIELAMEVMGADHVGLGSDYYGLGLAPHGLQDISRLPELTLALVKRGHSDDVILKILGANYLRVFEAVWN